MKCIPLISKPQAFLSASAALLAFSPAALATGLTSSGSSSTHIWDFDLGGGQTYTLATNLTSTNTYTFPYLTVGGTLGSNDNNALTISGTTYSIRGQSISDYSSYTVAVLRITVGGNNSTSSDYATGNSLTLNNAGSCFVSAQILIGDLYSTNSTMTITGSTAMKTPNVYVGNAADSSYSTLVVNGTGASLNVTGGAGGITLSATRVHTLQC